MELNIFRKDLTAALIHRGIPERVAEKHVESLCSSFSEEDIKEIEAIDSRNEIESLADNIAQMLKIKRSSAQSSKQSNGKNRTKQRPKPSKERKSEEADDDYFEYISKEVSTTKGIAIFWCALFLLSPIILALLVTLFGSFAAVFLAIIGLIIGSVAGIIALVACGTAFSLVGIIFGITQLFSFVESGIYEIGLGLIVIGAVLFVSILMYNFAVRVLPRLIRQVTVLLKFVCNKLKICFILIKKECYKL